MAVLPPLAQYPQASWRQHLSSTDWDSLSAAWIRICAAYLNLSDSEFTKYTADDESSVLFVTTYVHETAASLSLSSPSPSPALSKAVFQLASRLITLTKHQILFEFSFLAEFSKCFPKKHVAPVLSTAFARHGPLVESSLSSLKKTLIPHLDAGIKGDLKLVEAQLAKLNALLHVSPDACTLFLAGSDFFDGLVAGFRVMNPPLRKVIIATMYLCLIGLTDSTPPKWSMLGDQLFALKSAADTHKQGPLNVNDSLVPELVTSTPILKILLQRAQDSGAATDNLKKRITALEPFKKGAMIRPKRLVRRKVDKGKGKATQDDVDGEMHIHRLSQITQVQDLFPDLGAGFVSKCLDEYHNDVEQVVANLLSESLPPHLATADRGEPLSSQPQPQPDLAPRSTPPLPPVRHNIYDDDEFDRLAIDTAKLSFGKKPGKSADELLKDKSTAPNKAAILSALAAFDSDDDERDDTYDAADVGGTVDATTNQEADGANDANEETLFRTFQTNPKVFDRDAATRRGPQRKKLREDTGMADEALEGWALILTRNPQQVRRLEIKYAFSGQQHQIDRTSWRASPAGSGTEDSDRDGGASRGRGRGRGRGGGGRGRGNVAGPTGEKSTESARKNKEANKSSRANHNRREGRARKMARGGFGP